MRYLWSISIVFFILAAMGFRNQRSSKKESNLRTAAINWSFCAPAIQPIMGDTSEAFLLKNMGNYQRPINTTSDAAQSYFDQGMKLLFGFNHAEALRSFEQVEKLDKYCAMGYWGQAMALGPNINDPKPGKDREQRSWLAIKKAKRISRTASPVEQDMIAALSKRFSDTTLLNRDSLNKVYYKSMETLAKKYPLDDDIQVYTTAAFMNTTPWNYYTKDGTARPGVNKGVERLESVIKRNVSHPGAHHYYIHIVEASYQPERGIHSADILGSLVPNAGHLVHMPSHIYARVGRFDDAAQSNRQAILADEEYLAQYQSDGVYTTNYYPHNIHFLWFAASEQGQHKEAMAMANKLVEKVSDDQAANRLDWQRFLLAPLQTHLRFGSWNAILTMAQPDPKLRNLQLFWLHARTIAFARKGLLMQAETELSILEDSIALELERELAAGDAPDSGKIQMGTHQNTLLLEVARAALYAARGQDKEQIDALILAVNAQDSLPYREPPHWHQPVRHLLGMAYLNQDQTKEAIATFEQDLKWNQNNGWSLKGLQLSLEAEDNNDAARETLQRFRKAWINADTQIASAHL